MPNYLLELRGHQVYHAVLPFARGVRRFFFFARDETKPYNLDMLARDYILLYVNGRRHAVRGEAAYAPLSEFLRRELLLPGTKVVCAEGDCGACTVRVGRPEETGLRYQTADACILFVHQLDGRHVVTVEGLADGDRLTPVQQAMVDHHGSQCGYCTPGFVMALTGMLEDRPPTDARELRLALTGNLCRCTGYISILEAAAAV